MNYIEYLQIFFIKAGIIFGNSYLEKRKNDIKRDEYLFLVIYEKCKNKEIIN